MSKVSLISLFLKRLRNNFLKILTFSSMIILNLSSINKTLMNDVQSVHWTVFSVNNSFIFFNHFANLMFDNSSIFKIRNHQKTLFSFSSLNLIIVLKLTILIILFFSDVKKVDKLFNVLFNEFSELFSDMSILFCELSFIKNVQKLRFNVFKVNCSKNS